jgi:putative pyruvate formate lyase activating enzyme
LIAMQKQVGDLRINEKGVAEHGLLVRHLLMPGGIGEAKELFAFLVSEISANCYLNIMDQYRPCGEQLDSIPTRTITSAEYREVVRAAEEAGLARLDRRDLNVLLRRLLEM